MYNYSAFSVLIAPAIILCCALLVAGSARLLLILYRPLRLTFGAPSHLQRQGAAHAEEGIARGHAREP